MFQFICLLCKKLIARHVSHCVMCFNVCFVKHSEAWGGTAESTNSITIITVIIIMMMIIIISVITISS